MRRERELQIPRLPPDFLSGRVVSVNPMRLSSQKAAYVVALESSEVGNPEFARDDKGEGSAHLSSRYRGMDRAAARERVMALLVAVPPRFGSGAGKRSR